MRNTPVDKKKFKVRFLLLLKNRIVGDTGEREERNEERKKLGRLGKKSVL